MKKVLSLIAVVFALAFTANAQTIDMQINKTYCGVYSTVNSCLNLSVTTLDSNGQRTGNTGTIWLSYKPSSWPAGMYYLGVDNEIHYRTVTDYGFIGFKGFEGITDGVSIANPYTLANPPYPYQQSAITAINPDGSLSFRGTTADGRRYYGLISYTFSTARVCSGGKGGGGCHSTWTILGGLVSVTFE